LPLCAADHVEAPEVHPEGPPGSLFLFTLRCYFRRCQCCRRCRCCRRCGWRGGGECGCGVAAAGQATEGRSSPLLPATARGRLPRRRRRLRREEGLGRVRLGPQAQRQGVAAGVGGRERERARRVVDSVPAPNGLTRATAVLFLAKLLLKEDAGARVRLGAQAVAVPEPGDIEGWPERIDLSHENPRR